MEKEKEIPLLQRIERQALAEGQAWIQNRMKELIAEEEQKRRQAGKKKGGRRKKENNH
jgi:hypothetical protein